MAVSLSIDALPFQLDLNATVPVGTVVVFLTFPDLLRRQKVFGEDI